MENHTKKTKISYETALVTGAAGFIGFHLCKRLLDAGKKVAGIDNLTPYYDVELKKSRRDILLQYPGFHFCKTDIADEEGVKSIFRQHMPDIAVNLAAQAGVRYSLKNPHAYVNTNVKGYLNILESCRDFGVKHLVFASSSSVYGANTQMPFSVHHNVDHPVSLYAATKKANELMTHAYSHLFGIPATGLRFFTVYGPWGRPDMALFLFCKAILENRPIQVFNHGMMKRDFTYIEDIIEGVVRIMELYPEPDPGWKGDSPDPGTSYAPYRIYNIGNNQPVSLMEFITLIETHMGKPAQKEFLDMQPGDVPATYADTADLERDAGFKPSTPLHTGIGHFVKWYLSYYCRK